MSKKAHGDEVTDFYDKGIPKVDSNHSCLAVITWILLSINIKLLSTSIFKRV